MATKLLRSTRRIVTYLPSLRSIFKSARVFSSGSDHGLFGPKDYRLPLPGDIGLSVELDDSKKTIEPDVLTKNLPSERYCHILAEVYRMQMEMLKMDLKEESLCNMVEFSIHDCPALLKKDFEDLFFGRDLSPESSDPLTIITISQKTENDMSAWNIHVEKERENLLFYFIAFAEYLCKKLEVHGYWADFIDPSSGKPFLGPYVNSTFTETDERYRKLGYKIEDLGCCKVIEHHLWGSHAYIGSLFTNAPHTSDILKELLDMFTDSDSEIS